MAYLVLIAAYLLGSLPFGYILSKLLLKTDIRNYGSGNIGATNVLRVMGWWAALPVFILDLAKGLLAVLLAKTVSDLPAVYLGAGLLAMIGHSYPVFLKFKGGKAAATGIGVLIAISGWAVLVMLVAAALVIAVSRYVSVGSIVGAVMVPFAFWLLGYDLLHILFGALMALLVVIRHHENIRRLIEGRESKLGQKAFTDKKG